jgi:hypothetical protein
MRTATSAGTLGLPSSSAQGLGESLALPRRAYVTTIPGILLVTGFATWVGGNEIAMVVAAAVGGGISLYLLWDWLFREGPTRLSTLLTMALLQGYGLGALNTWLTLPRGGLTIAQFLGGDEAVLACGMAAVLIVCAPLCFLGELFERPLFGSEFRLPLDQRTYLFVVLGTAGVIAGFFGHAVGYMGTQGAAGGQVSVVGSLLGSLLPALTSLTIAVFLVVRGRFLKLLIGFCALALCIVMMAFGRRDMFYSAMLVIFSLRLTGYRLKGTFFKKLLLIVGLGLFLAVGVTVFMLLRLAGFQAPNGKPTMGQRIQVALTWVEEGTALSRATEANRTNVQKRTFVLGYFADVLDGSMRRTPALGKDAAGYVSLALPRVINPDKDLTFGEEALADAQFGLTYRDAANSILTNGATDFGFVGTLIYPLLAVSLFRLVINVLSRFLNPLPLAFISLQILFTLAQTETTIESYLDTIRDVIIFSFILGLFSLFPHMSLRNR